MSTSENPPSNFIEGEISIDIPFVEQPNIMAALGKLPREGETVISSEVLYAFLQISYQALSQKFTDRRLAGMKVGYERKIATSERTHRVESHFVADQGWSVNYEVQVADQVQLLTNNNQVPENTKIKEGSAREYLYLLTQTSLDEINRLYPNFQDCLEAHFYVFINFPSRIVQFSTRENLDIIAAAECPGCDDNGWNRKKISLAGGGCDDCD